MSTFGVMFTPDQRRAAAELLRVCRRGGKVGLANWTPDGFIGGLFATIGKAIAPPPGVRSPALWGTRARVNELFERHAGEIRTAQRHFVFRYRSPAHWIHVFKSYYGPMLKAFAALDAQAQAALEVEIVRLIARFNRSGDDDGGASEYLEVLSRATETVARLSLKSMLEEAMKSASRSVDLLRPALIVFGAGVALSAAAVHTEGSRRPQRSSPVTR
jgi:hypothetical protein